jgi:hypothetical protein
MTQNRRLSASGGSSSLILPATPRPKQTAQQRKDKAKERAFLKLGEVRAAALILAWSKLNPFKEEDRKLQDGILISVLANRDLSQFEIREFFKVGYTRLKRICGYDSTSSPVHLAKKHATTEESLTILQQARDQWLLEDGYPCEHKKPRLYFVEETTSWKVVHKNYCTLYHRTEKRNPLTKVLAYKTFCQYRRFFWPNVHLSRLKEDECDSCVKLRIISKFGETEEERQNAKNLLEKHVGAARDQRRSISSFTKAYIKGLIPEEEDVSLGLPEFLDSEGDVLSSLPSTQLVCLAEDYGSGVAMPHYGSIRPGSDYFNSNLTMNMYVQCDLGSNKHHVTLYDERCMGKGADALCSLRLAWHVRERKRLEADNGSPPKYFIGIYDNCVGQNKSNVTMKFAAYLSLVFYERVLLLFYLPGHSHMICDRVVGWCKRSIKGKNIYDPAGLCESMNGVNNVNCSYLSHTKSDRCAWEGFSDLFNKYFNPMPLGFTDYYVFEFFQGKVRIQPYCSSSPEEAFHHTLCPNPVTTAKKINWELWGCNSFSDVSNISQVILPVQKTCALKRKKLKSLAKKYDTIPSIFRAFYPDAPEEEEEEEEDEDEGQLESLSPLEQSPQKKKRKDRGIPGTRNLGRPPKKATTRTTTANQRSITCFFQTKK